MKVRFDKLFFKDLSKIQEKSVAIEIKTIILEIENVTTLSEVRNLKKLKGYKNTYRIRLGNYRIGVLFVEHDTIDFIRILPRKDIYKYFP